MKLIGIVISEELKWVKWVGDRKLVCVLILKKKKWRKLLPSSTAQCECPYFGLLMSNGTWLFASNIFFFLSTIRKIRIQWTHHHFSKNSISYFLIWVGLQKETQAHRYKEQIDGCQSQGVGIGRNGDLWFLLF